MLPDTFLVGFATKHAASSLGNICIYDDSWSHVKGFQKFSLCEMIVLQQSLNVD